MYIELQYQWIDISNLYLKHQKLQEVFKKLVDWGKKNLISMQSSCVNRIDRQYTNKFGKFELRVYTSIIAYEQC